MRVADAVAPAAFDRDAARVGALALVVAAAESAPLVAFGAIAAVEPAWQPMRGGTIDARVELDLRLRARGEGGLAVGAAGRPSDMAARGPHGRALVIPAATIDRVCTHLAEHGRVPIAYLGAGFRDVPVDDGHGAMVMRPTATGRPAAPGCSRAGSTAEPEPERHPITLPGRLRRR